MDEAVKRVEAYLRRCLPIASAPYPGTLKVSTLMEGTKTIDVYEIVRLVEKANKPKDKAATREAEAALAADIDRLWER
jgi:hypothetical protein